MGAVPVELPPSAELPQSARDLAARIGFDGLSRLVKCFGGTPLSIPRALSADWEPAGCLGEDLAAQLIEAFPGKRLTVPMLNTGAREQRNRAIVEDRREGQSPQQIARRYGVHVRTVQRILAEAR